MHRSSSRTRRPPRSTSPPMEALRHFPCSEAHIHSPSGKPRPTSVLQGFCICCVGLISLTAKLEFALLRGYRRAFPTTPATHRRVARGGPPLQSYYPAWATRPRRGSLSYHGSGTPFSSCPPASSKTRREPPRSGPSPAVKRRASPGPAGVPKRFLTPQLLLGPVCRR